MIERYPLLSDALREWISDLIIERREQTALTYRRILRPLDKLAIHTHDLTPADCRNFIAHQAQRGLSAATISTTVYALRSFANWCLTRGYMVTNPALNIAKPRKVAPSHRWLNEPQCRAMMGAARDVYDELVMLLLAGSGLRASEFCGLQWSDVNVERGTIRIYGKGAKYREISPGPEAMRLLSELRAAHPRKPVIPWGPDSLRDRVKRMGKAARTDVHPHMLRHTFAIQYLRASDGDAFSLQMLLGHSSPTQTAYYTRSFRQASATSRQEAVDLAGRLFGRQA